MARLMNRLNAKAVTALRKPGRHSDGGGLYLSVDKVGGRRWVFLYRDRRQQGKLREMGLGGAASVSLARAREVAAKCRAEIAAGRDPIDARKDEAHAERNAGITFGAFADGFVDELAAGFRNAKHIQQWRTTLKVDAASLRPGAIAKISTEDVLAVLKPIWQSKPETADRLRGRIERVLDAAAAAGLRDGANPARWRGHLKSILPKQKTLTRGHHKAIAIEDAPRFVAALKDRPSTASAALEFAILTAARTGEVLGAQ
jgi:hypothetical protein